MTTMIQEINPETHLVVSRKELEGLRSKWLKEGIDIGLKMTPQQFTTHEAALVLSVKESTLRALARKDSLTFKGKDRDGHYRAPMSTWKKILGNKY